MTKLRPVTVYLSEGAIGILRRVGDGHTSPAVRQVIAEWAAMEAAQRQGARLVSSDLIDFVRGLAEAPCCETPGCSLADPHCVTMVARAFFSGKISY